jgi:hypothetical protein
MMRQATTTNNELFNFRRGRVFFGLMMMALLFLASVERSNAQRVYGVSATRRTTVVSNGSTAVARRTTVVSNGSTTAVHRTTAVAAPVRAVGLPSGYIAVLPAGYRVVSGGFYMVGSVRYRASFYQGRTVYIRV